MSENPIAPSPATTFSYSFLKEKGIEYIQELSGKVWTDYNEHDPGITILEELCYALLDLDYRTNFDMEDLLAPPPDQAAEDTPKHFYHAAEILPCNPLTINDFLKLTVDVPGVKNAKILVHQGPQEIRGGYRVLLDLEERVRQKSQETQVIEQVRQKLYQHRNLCEDFFEVRLLKPFYIRINTAIEVKVDITQEESERLYAEVLFRINSFIAPYIKFYSLRNMVVDKNKTVEEIFTGPLLQQGFIDEQEIEENNSRSTIYVSELLQKITETSKVDNVMRFSVELEEGTFNNVVIEVPPESVPKVDIKNSNVTIYRNSAPVPVNQKKVRQHFEEITNVRLFKRPYLTEEEIAFREGRFRELTSYTSIQHDFPLNYSVGKEGLPNSASKERKAQAKQLKGYLLFFDQLLTNYLAQLAHVKDLLAIHAIEHRAYFSQVPEDAPALEELTKQPNLDKEEDADNEFKVQRKYLGVTPRRYNKKDKAQQELTKEAYYNYLSKIVAGKKHHRIKKNATLDHLLARFAETFVDYSLLFYGASQEKGLKTTMHDKSLFLQDYLPISRDRNKGLDLTSTTSELWDNDSLTGFERRIYRSLGIRDLNRRFLYETLKGNFYVEKGFDRQSLELFLGENLQSKYDNLFIFKGNFPQVRDLAIKQGIDEENYDIVENEENDYDIILYVDEEKDKSIELVHKEIAIKTFEQARALVRQAVRFFQTFNRESEGFHLVEHILLRHNTSFNGKNDPYSFTMSLVFPAWPARFQKASFRNLVHELVMLESPAHVLVNILWLTPEEMETFERAYKDWIDLRLTRKANDPVLNDAAKTLLGLLMLYAAEKT
ncbi:MAG: hypothetical protein AAFP88_01235 [Bacteroidota bacterium]